MQVGCTIRRAITSLGTLTAVGLIAATGVAGDEHRLGGDGAQAPDGVNTEIISDDSRSSKAKILRTSPATDMTLNVAPKGYAGYSDATIANFNQRGTIERGGDACDMPDNLDADLLSGMGEITVTGSTIDAPYQADRIANPELPDVSCNAPSVFGDFIGGGAKWFSFTGTGNQFSFELCGSDFDTSVSIMQGDCTGELVCVGGDNDSCGGPLFQSQGLIATNVGETYLLLVHGDSFPVAPPGSEGNFELILRELLPQTIDCSMADATENDPACIGAGNPGDDLNSGCNGAGALSDFNSLLLNGQTCGIISTESVGGTRDLDWYIFDIPEGPAQQVTITAEGTGPFNFFAFTFDGAFGTPGAPDCAGDTAVIAFGDAPDLSSDDGSALTGTACLAGGLSYVVVIGATDFESFDCGVNEVNYSLTVSTDVCATAACCLGDGTAIEANEPDCLAAGGVFFADGDISMGFACVGSCCLLEEDPGTMSRIVEASADVCDTLVTGGSARSFLGYNLTAEELEEAFCPETPSNISCDAALPVMTDGSSVVGNTEGSTFVAEGPTCGTAQTGAPGVWYTFAGTGNDVIVDLCLPGTDFDTRVSVFCGTCADLFCVDGDDDGPAGCGLSSQVTVGTNMGDTYYVLVFGFGTASGNFELAVTDTGTPSEDAIACELCDVTAPEDAIAPLFENCSTEGEPEANNGCNGDTAEGTSFTVEEYFTGDGNTTFTGSMGSRDGVADEDWYLIIQEESTDVLLTITVESEVLIDFGIFDYTNGSADADIADCDNLGAGSRGGFATADNCLGPVSIEICLPPGEWFLALQGDDAAFPNCEGSDDYYVTIINNGECATGACCLGDGTCLEGVTDSTCEDEDGAFFADQLCADTICTGACCLLGAPGESLCEDRSFDDCTNDPNFLIWNGIGTTCAETTDCPVTPLNGECEDAVAVTADGSPTTGTTNISDPSVWYSVVGNGNSYTVSLCGSDFDTTLDVFCDDCDEQRLIADNDDSDDCPDDQSQLTFCTEAGRTYLIQIDGIGTEFTGNFELVITDDGVACTDAPDCSPIGACCLGSDCVFTTELDCEAQEGCFLVGIDCGEPRYDIAVAADSPLVSIASPGNLLTVDQLAGALGAVDDEAVAVVQIPFDFVLFGDMIAAGSDLQVHANGFITFEDIIGSGALLFINPAEFPTDGVPNSVIAPQWDDFILNGNGLNGAWAEAQDNDAIPGDDTFIIEWNASPFGGDDNIVFQLELRDDNTVVFQYGTAFGGSPSAGLENADASLGTNVLADLGTISADERITLTFSDPEDACPTDACDVVGTLCTADLEGDFDVDLDDFSIFAAQFGSSGMGLTADIDGDMDVDLDDFSIFAAQFGNGPAACDPMMAP